MSRPLRIDLGDLEFAFEDASFETEHLLDLETGEVVFLSDDGGEVEDRIEKEPRRYAAVPKPDPHEGWSAMADFIGTVNEPHLRDLLTVAIQGKGAFRRFKDVLANRPQERERWFRFEIARVRAGVLEWLDGLGVDWAEKPPAAGPSGQAPGEIRRPGS